MIKTKRISGFTLIELLVVIAIIGILVVGSVVALNSLRGKSRDVKRAADIKQMQTAIELYFNDVGSYPPEEMINATTSPIYTGAIYSTSTGSNFSYMKRIPLSPSPADGTCDETNNNYVYRRAQNGNSYRIDFCLGANVSNLTAGINSATPVGFFALGEGIFFDEVVSGLNYSFTDNNNNTFNYQTDDKGRFYFPLVDYNPNPEYKKINGYVKFYIGNLEIGGVSQVSTDGYVAVSELDGRSRTDVGANTVKAIQILQMASEKVTIDGKTVLRLKNNVIPSLNLPTTLSSVNDAKLNSIASTLGTPLVTNNSARFIAGNLLPEIEIRGGGIRPPNACLNDADCSTSQYCLGAFMNKSCTTAPECSPQNNTCAEGLYCDYNALRCKHKILCSNDGPCGPGKLCDTSAGYCIYSCTGQMDCPTGTYCDYGNARCFNADACTSDSDCTHNQLCNLNTGFCFMPGCGSDSECGLNELCNTDTNTCMPNFVNYGGKDYHIIRIGGEYWLQENINVGTMIGRMADQGDAATGNFEKYCYNGSESSCTAYGGLYQWHTAMGLPDTCRTSLTCTEGVCSCGSYSFADPAVSRRQGICPPGWYVPTNADWDNLANYIMPDCNKEDPVFCDGIASKLKGAHINCSYAASGATWNNSTKNGECSTPVDTIGFKALPAGARYSIMLNYADLGGYAFFWAADYNNGYKVRNMVRADSKFYKINMNGRDGLSVRCTRVSFD